MRPMPRSERAPADPADLALALLLEPVAEDARVLWLGRDPAPAASLLGEVARSIRAFHPGDETPAGEPGPRVRVAELRPDGPRFRRGSFDLVVAPDLAAVALDHPEGLARLDRCRGDDGLLVVGLRVAAAGGAAEVRDRLGALVGEHDDPEAGGWRLYGQSRSAAITTAALGEGSPADDEGDEDGDEQVVLDGRLAARGDGEPERLVAVLGPGAEDLDGFFVADLGGRRDVGAERVPAGKVPGPPPGTGDAGRAVDVPTPRAPVAAPGPVVGGDEAEDPEVARLEAALAERGRVIGELRTEVSRRGAIVRDLVEELRKLNAGAVAAEPAVVDGAGAGTAAPASVSPEPPTISAAEAIERALDAELALTEARFRLDELTAELEALRRSGAESPEGAAGATTGGQSSSEAAWAALEGRARGLAARLAETEERLRFAEARATVVDFDAEDARDKVLVLERRAAELEDEVGRLLARERAMAGDTTLPRLRGEVAGLRHRLGDREAALVAVRDAGPPSPPRHDAVGSSPPEDRGGTVAGIERDLGEARAREARATLALAAVEERAEAAEAWAEELARDLEGCRAALAEQTRRGDEAERALGEAKGILAGLTGIASDEQEEPP